MERRRQQKRKTKSKNWKKMVKNMVNKAAFKEYLAKKETHKKIKKLEYLFWEQITPVKVLDH